MRYRPENVDDAWNFSWVVALLQHKCFVSGVFHDYGVMGFTAIWAFIQGLFLEYIFGWTKEGIHYVSFLFGLLSLFFFYLAFKKLISKNFALVFILLFSISEPFIGMLTQARVEAFCLFLISLSLYSVAYSKFFFTGLTIMLSFESHPSGFLANIVLTLITVWYFKKQEFLRKKSIIQFAVGIILGIFLYAVIHIKYLKFVPDILLSSNMSQHFFWNPLFMYYFKTKYLRHLPELLLLLLALLVYFKVEKKCVFQKSSFITLISLFLLFTIIVKRHNFHYAVYFYIGYFAFLVSLVINRTTAKVLTIVVFILLWGSQYGYVLLKNWHTYDDYKFLQRNLCNETIPKNLFVLTDPNGYWALFKHKHIEAYTSLENVIQNLKERSEALVVCSDYHIPNCSEILKEKKLIQLGDFNVLKQLNKYSILKWTLRRSHEDCMVR